MEGPMAPATWVAEDGLVGHQREERPWTHEGSWLQGRGMAGQGSRGGWVSEHGEGGWDRGLSEGKWGKGTTFEM